MSGSPSGTIAAAVEASVSPVEALGGVPATSVDVLPSEFRVIFFELLRLNVL